MMAKNRHRLDQLLVERGLAESQSAADRLIMAGRVRVDGQVIYEPARAIPAQSGVSVAGGPQYVSRGGEKLEPALAAFGLEKLDGAVCADVGASTGGFTDCLLQHGAGKVYAIDVGYGILHWKLRSDPRVVVMERINARQVASLPESIRVATIDASFISLRTLLPVAKGWLAQDGQVVALIKPQFEAEKDEVDKGKGVIHDAVVHERVLRETLAACEEMGYRVAGLIRSPVKGPKGNVEFLVHLTLAGGQPKSVDSLIRGVLQV